MGARWQSMGPRTAGHEESNPFSSLEVLSSQGESTLAGDGMEGNSHCSVHVAPAWWIKNFSLQACPSTVFNQH